MPDIENRAKVRRRAADGTGELTVYSLPGTPDLYERCHERVESFLRDLIDYGAGHSWSGKPAAYVAEGSEVKPYITCASGSLDPSHVLLSLGIPYELARGSLRLSIGEYNTDADIDYILETVPRAVESLRSMSPLWKEYAEGRREHLC